MNWLYENKEIRSLSDFPETAVGFIYKVTNIGTNRFYIGRKVLYNNTSKTLTKKEIEAWIKPGRVPRKKKIVKESDWLDYYGSNKTLNLEKKEFGSDIFSREILKICYSKKQLTYWEVYYQMNLNVLGIDSYNDNIQGRFYRKDV